MLSEETVGLQVKLISVAIQVFISSKTSPAVQEITGIFGDMGIGVTCKHNTKIISFQ